MIKNDIARMHRMQAKAIENPKFAKKMIRQQAKIVKLRAAFRKIDQFLDWIRDSGLRIFIALSVVFVLNIVTIWYVIFYFFGYIGGFRDWIVGSFL